MQPHGVYNVSVSHSGEGQRLPRVGLIPQRTGIPLFLLYLNELCAPRHIVLHSMEDVESEVQRASKSGDKKAWQTLLPFFEVGAQYAHVVALPLSDARRNRVQEMIGQDKGLLHRTGIHSIKSLVEYADVVVVPQASLLLSPTEHARFYRCLCELVVELEHYFVIIDFPVQFTRETAYGWLKKAHYPSAAAYFPWILKKGEVLPPGALVAGAYQVSDQLKGIHEIPANHALEGRWKPLVEHGPSELRQNLESRLNTLHVFPDGSHRLWGGHCLTDRLDFDGRFVSTRRTVLALKEAIQRICEPFVLEPASEDVTDRINVTLQSFFQGNKKIFSPDQRASFSTSAEIAQKGGEDIVKVHVKFSLPHSLSELSLSMGMTG